MHLFYMCHKTKHVLDELKHVVNIIFEKEYSTCCGKGNPWVVWGRINCRPTFSEFDYLYIKIGNLENKKLHKLLQGTNIYHKFQKWTQK